MPNYEIDPQLFFTAFLNNLRRILFTEDDPSRLPEAHFELAEDLTLSFEQGWESLGSEIVFTYGTEKFPVAGPDFWYLEQFDLQLIEQQPALYNQFLAMIGQAIEATGDWKIDCARVSNLPRSEREPIAEAMREVAVIHIALIINRRILENVIPKRSSLGPAKIVEILVTRTEEREGLMDGLQEYCTLLDAHNEEVEGTTLGRVLEFIEMLVPSEEE